MRNRHRDSVRCSCVCADGSPCGRRVTDGSQPPVCHVHRAVAAGNPHNGGSVNPRRSKTPEQVVEDLLHSKDDAIRLRAADVFLKRQEREAGCPTCQARIADDGTRERAIHRMTYEQRMRVRALIDEIKTICAVAISQPLTWDGERGCYSDSPATPIERTLSAPVAPDAIAMAVVVVAPDEIPNPPIERRVDPQHYADVGLFIEDEVVTHALGDEYAQAVLEGHILFEDARARQEAFEHKLKRMA